MLKRLIVGLVLGTVVGAVLAAVLVQGLGVWSFAVSGAVFAYLAAAVTGVLTGFVAGKPIWSADGKIEAGLKAFFGALLSLGGMFALRQWVDTNVDLSMLHAGTGEIGDLPAASLPLIAAVLAAFFEIDNTGDKASKDEGQERSTSTKALAQKVRVAEEEDDVDEDEEEAAVAKKRR